MENYNKTKNIRQQQAKRLVSSLPEFQEQFNLLSQNEQSVYNYFVAAFRKYAQLRISHIRIAKAIGLRRETVCKIVKKLQSVNLLISHYRFRKTSCYVLPVLLLSLLSRSSYPEHFKIVKARLDFFPREKLTLLIKKEINIFKVYLERERFTSQNGSKMTYNKPWPPKRTENKQIYAPKQQALQKKELPMARLYNNAPRTDPLTSVEKFDMIIVARPEFRRLLEAHGYEPGFNPYRGAFVLEEPFAWLRNLQQKPLPILPIKDI